MKKNKKYIIMLDIKLSTDMEVVAKSFEEALEKANGLDVKDVVSFEGNYNDGNVEVTGVYNG